MDTSKEKICHIIQFFFDKGKNTSQVVKNVNNVYGPDTITINHAQFWFHQFRSGSFDIKDAPRTGTPIMENVESNRNATTILIAQTRVKGYTKNVWNHLNKVGY